jgi:hypothetical protein
MIDLGARLKDAFALRQRLCHQMRFEGVEILAWQRREQLVIQRTGRRCVQLRLSARSVGYGAAGGKDCAAPRGRSAGMPDTRIGTSPCRSDTRLWTVVRLTRRVLPVSIALPWRLRGFNSRR